MFLEPFPVHFPTQSAWAQTEAVIVMAKITINTFFNFFMILTLLFLAYSLLDFRLPPSNY
jgi:hypothetical protein